MRIGIPKGLYYYEYGDLWTRFFEELGHECVFSEGYEPFSISCTDEACLPIKAYHKYTQELLKKDIDFLFSPRIVKCTQKGFTCPKIIGINEMIRASLKPAVKLITPEFNGEFKPFFADIGKTLGEEPQKVLNAIEQTMLYNNSKITFVSLAPIKKHDDKHAEYTICLLGHKYLTEDPVINMDIKKRLRKLGIRSVTTSYFDNDLLSLYSEQNTSFPPFWITGRQATGLAALSENEQNEYDGCIYLTSFGCGPDSFIVPLTKKHLMNTCRKPFMEISFDEHTSTTGLDTRLEAFADMLKERITV